MSKVCQFKRLFEYQNCKIKFLNDEKIQKHVKLSDCIFFKSEKYIGNPPNKTESENQLSAQIIALLEHYKKEDPVGIPGTLVTDPFPIPNADHAIGIGHQLTTIDALVYGFSKFRIKNVAIDVEQLMVMNIFD